MQWWDAENYCQEMGGHLASLHDGLVRIITIHCPTVITVVHWKRFNIVYSQSADFVRRSAVSLGVAEGIYIG